MRPRCSLKRTATGLGGVRRISRRKPPTPGGQRPCSHTASSRGRRVKLAVRKRPWDAASFAPPIGRNSNEGHVEHVAARVPTKRLGGACSTPSRPSKKTRHSRTTRRSRGGLSGIGALFRLGNQEGAATRQRRLRAPGRPSAVALITTSKRRGVGGSCSKMGATPRAADAGRHQPWAAGAGTKIAVLPKGPGTAAQTSCSQRPANRPRFGASC